MAEDTSAWTEPLSGENIATLDRLVRAVDMAAGFALFFARCNVPAMTQRLVERARHQLDALGVAVIEVALDSEATNLRARLRREMETWQATSSEAAPATLTMSPEAALVREAAAPYRATPKAALFVSGLEYSIPYDRPNARILAELNLGRDLFRRDVPAPVVFWLPDYAITAIARHAPDFWAWRSGVFEFTTEEAVRTAAFTQVVHEGPGLAALSNLSPSAKRARRRQLESLLDDYQGLPEDQRTLRERMAILADLGDVCEVQGDYPAALRYFQEALALAHRTADRQAEAEAKRSAA
ncbi:MAG: hypothetical protein RMN53_17810, partial [Anaerolineae bacterium]|nr:hypothetical protein [Anaerolineae bacterium]